MDLGIGLGLTMQRRRGRGNPFASLMSSLLSGASQLIAHPLEYGSMFIDRAGTTPVTAPGQLVGLVLDHGLTGKAPVPGPELVTNGDYSDGTTGWTLTGGWAITGGQAVKTGSTVSDISQSVSIVGGKTYEIAFDLVLTTGVNLPVRLGGATNLFSPTASGSYSVKLVAESSNTNIIFAAGTGFTGSIDNISVRELPGYHATAVSDAARGIYREVGGLKYIEYNGVNTAYQTPVLPAPGVDKAQVFAGVRKLVDVGLGTVMETSVTSASNNGALALASTGTSYFTRSRGTVQSVAASSATFAAPITNVLTGLGDISGDRATLRINGTQVAQSTDDQGTGNYLAYPMFIGARGGTSLFFNGHHYGTLGPITRFGTNATPEQIAAAEAYYTKEAGL